MDLRVDPRAATLIRRRGGDLYVWTEDAGDYGFVRWAFARPDDVDAFVLAVDLVRARIHVAEGLDLGPGALILYRWFPRRRVEVAWTPRTYAEPSVADEIVGGVMDILR